MTSPAMDIDITRETSSEQWSEIQDSEIITLLETASSYLSDYSFENSEVSVVLSTSQNVHQLNLQYREKDKPTNILSFPINDNGNTDGPLGDLVLAYEVVKEEAKNEDKSFQDHTTHLLLHGLLHLLGHDHIEDEEAETMEALEIKVLGAMGIKNPYAGAT